MKDDKPELTLPVEQDKKRLVDEKHGMRGNYTAQESKAGVAWNESDEESRL